MLSKHAALSCLRNAPHDRSFDHDSQTAPVSEDSRLETPPEHAQAAAKRGKASGAAGAAEAESLDSMRPATNSRADGGKPADQEAPPARSQGTYWLMQPVYRTEYVESIQPKHLPPKKVQSVFTCSPLVPCLFPMAQTHLSGRKGV